MANAQPGTARNPNHGAEVSWFPPPLYFLVGILLGAGLNWPLPLHLGGRPATTVIGIVLAVAGLALAAVAASTIFRHKTTIVPHQAVSALVTTGVYRLSRNPIYTAMTILYLGVTLLIGTYWPLILLLAVITGIQTQVIGPEERYLSAAFPEQYAAYRARVRRWL